jgi:hypothetical protein
MSEGYDIVYPRNGRITFDGGLNNKFERAAIADNETPDCYNVVFGNASVETRGGTTKLNTSAIGSFVGDGLYTRRDNTGAETMVAFAGGTAWQWTGTTFSTISSAQSVFTAGVRVATAQYENHMFVGNGYVTPYKYNGVAWTRHGVPIATGVVSAASITSSTGVLNGDYRYKIAYVNSQAAIGDVGTATVTATVTNGKIYLTGIPTAPQSHGVAARRIYRNFASGVTSSYGLLATLSDNTTTTYVDNSLDSTLGATPPTDNGEPPKYNAVVTHQNRLFMNDVNNPNYIWYSEALEPYTVKATNFLPVGDASQDLVKGLEVYDNALVVLCERAVYMILMPSTDPTDWYVLKTRSPYGTRSPFSTFNYNNKLMFGAQQNGKFVGFASLAGSTLDQDATLLDSAKAGSDLKTNRIESNMFDVQELYLKNVSAIVWKNKAYMSVTSGTNQTTNNLTYIFDFSIADLNKYQEASWSVMSGPAVAQFTVYDGKLYGIDATATGFVRELVTSSYIDDTTAINSYFWTKEFSGLPGHENLQKDFRKVYLLVEKVGNYYMTFSYRVNSDNGIGDSRQLDMSNGADTWGFGNWGNIHWGAGTAQEEIEIPLGTASGKRIQFKFSNQNVANQRFKVIGMKFKYNVKGKR